MTMEGVPDIAADGGPAPGGAPPSAAARIPFEFRADGGEYFRIWIVNLALTVVTIGIYSAWAKVRKQRYFYGNTLLAGSAFGYHADPVKILKGRIIAALLAVCYFGANRISPFLFLGVALALAAITPWLVVKSRLFTMRVTSWRGIRFDFEADYAGAYRTFLGWLVLSVLTLGILIPRFNRERYRFIVTRSGFGGRRFESNPGIWRFYKTALVVLGMLTAFMFAMAMLAATLAFSLKGAGHSMGPKDARIITIVTTLLIYGVLFPIVIGYTQVRNLNEVFDHSSIGSVRIHSTLSAGSLIGIYFTNLLGIVFTLGLYTPWAQVRLARYRFRCLEVVTTDSLEQFVAGAARSVPAAAGEEISSFFDLDFGF